jgi:hypothetical protein
VSPHLFEDWYDLAPRGSQTSDLDKLALELLRSHDSRRKLDLRSAIGAAIRAGCYDPQATAGELLKQLERASPRASLTWQWRNREDPRGL